MAESESHDIEPEKLVEELRRESLQETPKERRSVEDDDLDDVIHEARCAYVVLLMAAYWMTEVLPLPVTSLIPIALFPPLGVMTTDEACLNYFKDVNVMLIGGLIMANAIEYCNLHSRIALKVILLIGTSPRLLMLGFMITTMFLSMWISNTAATAMTAPIVTAVLKEINKKDDSDGAQGEQNDKTEDQLEFPQANEEKAENTDTEDLEKGISEEEKKTQDERTAKEDSTKAAEERHESGPVETADKMTTGYFLSLCFASTIGGTGTLIGTGTNLIFVGMLKSMFPESIPVNFAAWMALTVPIMLLCTFFAWIWLQVYFLRLFRGGLDTGGPEAEKRVRILIQDKYNTLGKITQHELSVLILFGTLILAWIFRAPQFITGWAEIISDKEITDSTPAIFFVLLLFLLPADSKFASCTGNHEVSPALLKWSFIHKKLPWGLILLLGGGFAMATGFAKSGLSKLIGQKMTVFSSLPPFMIATIVSSCACLLTQVTSNTSCANIFLPVLGEMARTIKINPLYLMIPTTLACSYAFMLPVGTPANAIVQAASNLRTIYMMRAGAVMSIICMVTTMTVFQILNPILFDTTEFPDWAK
ncbi:sodium-dependent high-affinity dicarboxylate transporter 3-like isoform X2 [Ischnura elegans]|uniref:sodium-dependent high-affinity dicarboxylate transporter 3-like isoform X2 n=1 Tax=Ischnura elegans TaxID=197161 RepID=UPI001ED87A76|nr:sodium-dependent high-affinity dicarboxylate transporter 3-like isoform X2 [Ischnura elegans]